MFSWEFCEISKNTFFTEHLRWLLLMHVKLILDCTFSSNSFRYHCTEVLWILHQDLDQCNAQTTVSLLTLKLAIGTDLIHLSFSVSTYGKQHCCFVTFPYLEEKFALRAKTQHCFPFLRYVIIISRCKFQSESPLHSLPEYQGTPCSKQVTNLKFKWQQRDSNTQACSS